MKAGRPQTLARWGGTSSPSAFLTAEVTSVPPEAPDSQKTSLLLSLGGFLGEPSAWSRMGANEDQRALGQTPGEEGQLWG